MNNQEVKEIIEKYNITIVGGVVKCDLNYLDSPMWVSEVLIAAGYKIEERSSLKPTTKVSEKVENVEKVRHHGLW